MAKGFKINGTDFDDVFEPTRSGFSSVTFTGLSPTCTYMARTGNASNPNADGYWKYNGVAYDAHPKGYMIPKSLTVGGSWSNYQYINNAPNTGGLSYTATYQDGSTESVSVSVSPSTWSSTPGTQTATFSYTYHGVTVTATKSASVVKKPYSLTVAGSWSNYQYYNYAPDTTGLGWTVTYEDGSTASKSSSSISISPSTWTATGSQTATFSYTENGVTVSASSTVSVVPRPTSLTVGGSWSNTQYTGEAVDYTGLSFTITYNDGGTRTVTRPDSYSPTTWSNTVGTQTCTFYYTANGITVSGTKNADVVTRIIVLDQFTVPINAIINNLKFRS